MILGVRDRIDLRRWRKDSARLTFTMMDQSCLIGKLLSSCKNVIMITDKEYKRHFLLVSDIENIACV